MTLPIPQKSTASYFYKYSSSDHLEWLRVILLEHKLYLPDLTQLNDDNDGLPKLAMQSEGEMVSFVYGQFVKNNPHMESEELRRHEAIIRFNIHAHGPQALHPSLVKSLDSQFKDFKIYSMSKRYDMPHMWALYADNHRGYCLEFANVPPLFDQAREVSYLPSDDMLIAVTDPDLREGRFLFCKTLDWSNEEEVRLVRARTGSNIVIIDPRWLTRIILGRKMADVHNKQIREWAKERVPQLSVATAFYDAINRAIRIEPEQLDRAK
jgi:hypothetical protein